MSASSPSLPSNSWHFPGPSSKYHKREKSRPKHIRFTSNPELSPELNLTRSRSLYTYTTPSRAAASPLTRFTSLPYSTTSYHSDLDRPSSALSMDRDAPMTPIRGSSSRSSALLHDSPFSDYFSDSARSVVHDPDPEHQDKYYSMPSSETQRLLLRLNDLGAQILRHEPSAYGLEVLKERLDALEDALRAPDAQTRQPAELADSGLFMEEDEEEEDDDGDEQGGSQEEYETEEETKQSLPSLDGAADLPKTPQRLDDMPSMASARKAKMANQDRLLKEAQAVLERVTKAHTSLRARYEEMRHLNDQHILQLEDSAQQALQSKSETEALKADLGFDHSELLFLKLQLKALEVQADSLAQKQLDEVEERKRISLVDDMARWKADWHDVDARLRRRRERHGIVSSTPRRLSGARDGLRREEEGEWSLETCRKKHGRVQSITIKRLDALGLDGAEEEEGPFASEDEPEKPAYCDLGVQTDVKLDVPESGDAMVEWHEEVVVPVEKAVKAPKKTPWQELWDGLSALAGMDADE